MDGHATGVIIWWDLDMDPESAVRYSTAPWWARPERALAPDWSWHWRQARTSLRPPCTAFPHLRGWVQRRLLTSPFDGRLSNAPRRPRQAACLIDGGPLPVAAGQTLSVSAAHDDFNVWFRFRRFSAGEEPSGAGGAPECGGGVQVGTGWGRPLPFPLSGTGLGGHERIWCALTEPTAHALCVDMCSPDRLSCPARQAARRPGVAAGALADSRVHRLPPCGAHAG